MLFQPEVINQDCVLTKKHTGLYARKHTAGMLSCKPHTNWISYTIRFVQCVFFTDSSLLNVVIDMRAAQIVLHKKDRAVCIYVLMMLLDESLNSTLCNASHIFQL